MGLRTRYHFPALGYNILDYYILEGESVNAIHIHGEMPLCGEVKIQGSKNAILPVLAATLLIKGTCIIQNCPDISDVGYMLKLLKCIGCTVCMDNHEVVIDAINIKENRLPKEYVTSMRSSVILMGALLARTGEVSLDYPGGCVIGERPIDIHVEALRQLGTEFINRDNGLTAKASKLNGKQIKLPFPSVGATENIILAAALAQGVTIIHNSAKEPEIKSLCEFLNLAGAKITGYGTESIYIEGVEQLSPVVYKTDSDRIVAGTYLFGALATGGEITLRNAPVLYMTNVIDTAMRIGANIHILQNDVIIKSSRTLNALPIIETMVYPGFPSDLQSMLLVVLSLAQDDSIVRENIFSSRFKAAEELNRMGDSIQISGRDAHIKGNRKFNGKIVVAEDLRGGAALVLAGLCARGDTFINNYQFIERGYEDICRDCRELGAVIRRYCEETKIQEKETQI